MLKELLQQQEPTVYEALENACTKHQVSSAYLFSGPYGTPKKEAAILFAQSILCDSEGLACEECNTCRRVRENNYADLVILDGKEASISKEMIDGVQEKFSKTALEQKGFRIYIVLNIENATIAAQNSMLKFLEEPGLGITAIFTTDNENKVLPTILSRCARIPFTPLAQSAYTKMVIDAKIPQDDVYFLSHIAKTFDDLNFFYPDYEEDGRKPSKEYESILGMLKQFLDEEDCKHFLVDYEFTWKSKEKDSKKAKVANIAILNGFFDLLMTYCHDVILQQYNGPMWYQDAVKNARGTAYDYSQILQIVADEKDKVNRFNDLNLLIDQAFYRLEVYRNEHRR